MADSALTRPSLLIRLRDAQDRQAWSEFVGIYAPLVYAFAQRHRLQDADAADLTQDVLRAVAGAIKRLDYDPRKGSFRGWLFTIVRNKLRTFLSRRGRPGQGSGDSDQQRRLADLPAREPEDSALWNQAYERRLFEWACEQIRGDFQDSTWQAFRLTAIEGMSGKEASRQLGLSTAAVYLAKRRVMVRLRETIQQLKLE